MILTNLDHAPGYTVTELLGLVKGNVAQGAGSVGAVMDSISQNESEEYTKLLEEARLLAEKRMVSHAKRLDADAVLGISFTSSVVGTAHVQEIFCVGTAVRLRPE